MPGREVEAGRQISESSKPAWDNTEKAGLGKNKQNTSL